MDELTEKLLRLCGAENEHEAANALRRLVRIKTKDGKSWNEFVDKLKSGDEPAHQGQGYTSDGNPFATQLWKSREDMLLRKMKEERDRRHREDMLRRQANQSATKDQRAQSDAEMRDFFSTFDRVWK